MILTSGTLSPLESFSSELQISFPIRLENKHLICSKQVCVSVLEKGPVTTPQISTAISATRTPMTPMTGVESRDNGYEGYYEKVP